MSNSTNQQETVNINGLVSNLVSIPTRENTVSDTVSKAIGTATIYSGIYLERHAKKVREAKCFATLFEHAKKRLISVFFADRAQAIERLGVIGIGQKFVDLPMPKSDLWSPAGKSKESIAKILTLLSAKELDKVDLQVKVGVSYSVTYYLVAFVRDSDKLSYFIIARTDGGYRYRVIIELSQFMPKPRHFKTKNDALDYWDGLVKSKNIETEKTIREQIASIE